MEYVVSQSMQKCLQNKVKVYPEFDKISNLWYVVIESVNGIQKGEKRFKPKEINKALQDTYIYLAKKL